MSIGSVAGDDPEDLARHVVLADDEVGGSHVGHRRTRLVDHRDVDGSLPRLRQERLGMTEHERTRAPPGHADQHASIHNNPSIG